MNIYDNRVYQVYNDEYSEEYGAISTLGVFFITNKQLVFESQMWTEENNYLRNGPTHPGIVESIDEKIYDNPVNNQDTFRREYNAYIYLYKDNNKGKCSFLIFFPENGILSASQYVFLCKTLDELEEYIKYTKLLDDSGELSISILTGGIENDDLSIEETRKRINEHMIGFQEIHEERIIGETLSDDKIDEVIRKYIDFSKCNSVNDLLGIMKLCDRYYNDSYYRDYFLKVFPNYLEVKQLIDEMNFSSDNMTIVGVSLNNIYDVLNGYYNTGRTIVNKRK